MDKKAMFLKAIARLQNAISIEDTKTRLFEKALDDGSGETRIFDFTISHTCFEATLDILYLMFPNIKPEVIEDYFSWYIYETPDMDNPYIEIKDEKGKPKKRFEINTPESIYEFLEQYDKTE